MLGVLSGRNYPKESLELDPGNVLVTNAITEARSEERFLAEEDAPPSELVDRLLEKAKEYGNGHLQDDVAIVALGLEKSGAEVRCIG